MDPVFPADPKSELGDLTLELVSKASALAGQLPDAVKESVGDLVRSMNCYYSNLIEGHDTHPRDIDRALTGDYSDDAPRRVLQLEARAHIEVQQLIDAGEDPDVAPTDVDYLLWLHGAFCERLPDELLWVESPDTGKRVKVEPGAIRTGDVQVGRHVPPGAHELDAFLSRFQDAYAPGRLSKAQRITAVAAAHHRVLWIHPFYDGNGRVARLMSHAQLLRAGVGGSLWSVARGLARNVERYKASLMVADQPRQGDLDGRGALSDQGLRKFSLFFLGVCIDQVAFMESLLQPAELLRRMKLYVDDEVAAGRLPRGSFGLLREAFLVGDIERGRAAELTGYKERRGRQVLVRLLESGLLVSRGPRSPVRLGFPLDVIERWFPRLYPVD